MSASLRHSFQGKPLWLEGCVPVAGHLQQKSSMAVQGFATANGMPVTAGQLHHCTYARSRACTQARTHARTHTRTHARTHVRTHVAQNGDLKIWILDGDIAKAYDNTRHSEVLTSILEAGCPKV